MPYYRTLFEDNKVLKPAVIFIDDNMVTNQYKGVKYRRLQYVTPQGVYVLMTVYKRNKK